jgi:hypothetical protein
VEQGQEAAQVGGVELQVVHRTVGETQGAAAVDADPVAVFHDAFLSGGGVAVAAGGVDGAAVGVVDEDS